MEQLYWGWLIVIYLFLGGLGAGAYLTSFAAERGWLGEAQSLARVGYFLAAPLVATGTGLLIFDLGQGLHKPWLLIGLLTNPRSVMTWGTYILSLFICVGLVKAYFAWKQKTAPSILTYAGAVLALATGTYTGLLISDVQAIPFWNTFMMPIFFLVSALSTGMSVTSLVAPLVEKGQMREGRICQAHLLFVSIEIVVATVFFWTMLSGSHGPSAAQSASMIISGNFSLVFWILFVIVGLVLPLIAYTLNTMKQRRLVAQLEDAIPAVTVTEEGSKQLAAMGEHGHSSTLIGCDIGALLGGFVLRYLVIFAAIPVWNGFLG